MKKVIYSLTTVLSVLIIMSCEKSDEAELVSPEFSNIEVSCGQEFEIPVLTQNWIVERVQDLTSGEVVLDKKQSPITLEKYGEVEAANDWLILGRNKEDAFFVRLKENFNETDRRFTICINDQGKRDYITVTQTRGKNYTLVKKDVQEIEELREIYVSNDGCHRITLTNNTSEPVWLSCHEVFNDVVYSSQFQSDDFGAFDWISEEDAEIHMPELIIDNAIRWDNSILYKPGITTSPYLGDSPGSGEVLIEPYTVLYLKGEITYCKRVCKYTFTIKNESSGTRFDIRGVWTQIVPIVSHTIGSDKLE